MKINLFPSIKNVIMITYDYPKELNNARKMNDDIKRYGYQIIVTSEQNVTKLREINGIISKNIESVKEAEEFIKEINLLKEII